MKITTLLLVIVLVQASAKSFSQKITLHENNAPLEKVVKTIKRQSGYLFLYDKELQNERITVEVKNVGVEEALRASFTNTNIDYKIVGNSILLKRGEAAVAVKVALVPVTVTGTVIDENKQPMPSVTVTVKGTEVRTGTDVNGRFTLPNVDDKAILVFTYIGYKPKEVAVRANLGEIQMAVLQSELEEVNVAYGKTTLRENVSALTVIKGEQIQSLPTRSIDRALQGMVPGLQITSGSGMPGGNVSNITLRGIATGGDGIARNPLYVVDGTPVTQENLNQLTTTSNTVTPANPMAQINPNDIESISVLKDAAAIALYGSRASNGVILITTKKGKSGKLRVTFRHQTDISERVKTDRNVLNQEQYLELLYETYKNTNPVIWTDQAIFNDLKNRFPYQIINGDTSFYPAPDWNKQLYSNRAITVTNDVSFSGGSEKTTYYLGLGHLTQNGVLKGSAFERSSLRYNIDINPVKWFKLGINSSLAHTRQDHTGVLADAITSVTGFGDYASPLLPIRQDNGNYFIYYSNGAGGSTIANPVAVMEYNQYKTNGYRALGNIFSELKFLKQFSFRTNLSLDVLYSKDVQKLDKRVDGSSAPGTGSYIERIGLRNIFLINNLLRYQQTFRNTHSINVLLSQEAQTENSDLTGAVASGFSSGRTDDEISSATTRTATGNRGKTTLLSYFAQANYDYKKKYYSSASIRLDGSSRFGVNIPLRKYWSFGAGWIVSEESVLKNVNWISFLKLRGSLGVAGNTNAIPQEVRYNTVEPIIPTNSPATIGSAVTLNHGNLDINSESTYNVDMGLEARFWDERISLTADVYKRKTYDMVSFVPTPLNSGRFQIYDNIGDVENKGVELSLSVDIIRNKNFTWNINGNWSANSNKLVKATDPESLPGGTKFINKVGENFNSWYLARWAGVDPADGSPQWYDSEGKITKTLNNSNRVIAGKPQPDGFGAVNIGFRYKQLELNTFFYYAYGFKIYNSYVASMSNDGNFQPYSNQSVLALDRWQKPGDIASNPKRVLNNTAGGNFASTRYLVDGDYVRLKNIMLSYTLNNRTITKLNLSQVKVFIQANNIALWTKAKALDPDNAGVWGESLAAYPQQKSFSLGLSINL